MLDVLVVGAGPAGATAALSLLAASPGLRVEIVERLPLPRDKPCAGALGGRAERTLAALGIAPRAPSVAVRALSCVGAHGRVGAREPGPIGRVYRRAELDLELARAAEARGAVLSPETRLVGLDRRADRVVARLEGRAARDVEARVVVGADGVGSAVRRALGLPRGPVLAQAVEVDTEPLAGEPDDELRFDLSDRSLAGYAWDFPTPLGGRVRASRGVYALRAPGGPDVGERLCARLDRLGVRPLGPPRRYAERGFVPGAPLSAPRVILVGEAGGIDPVLGEGIAQAIQLGDLAGAFLARALARGELGLEGWASAVARARVGLDLHARSRATRLVYGAARARFEAALFAAPSLARAGARYFAGTPVARSLLARAALELARGALRGPGAATSCRPSAPSS